MNIHCTFKNMESTEALKAHTNSMSEKLNKFYSGVADVHWILAVEGSDHVAEIRLSAPHLDLFAHSKTENMYDSIDDAVHKMERQLRKHKEMTKNHLHRG